MIKRFLFLALVTFVLFASLCNCTINQQPPIDETDSETRQTDWPVGEKTYDISKLAGINNYNILYDWCWFEFEGQVYLCRLTEKTPYVITSYSIIEFGSLTEVNLNSIREGDTLEHVLRTLGPSSYSDGGFLSSRIELRTVYEVSDEKTVIIYWNIADIADRNYIVKAVSVNDSWPIGHKPEELYERDGVTNIGHVYGAYYWFNYEGKFYLCEVSRDEPFVIESCENIQLGVCTDETINEIHVGEDTVEIVLAKVGLPVRDGTANSYISSIFETTSETFYEIKWTFDESGLNLIVGDIIAQ